MERLRHLNIPVLVFVLVLLTGWGLFLYFGDWWWLPGAILAGIIAGDMMDNVVHSREEKKKGKGGGSKR